MIVLEERSGVVSPTKTSSVPEQNDVASFYEYQSFAIVSYSRPFLSVVQVLLLQVLFNIILFYQNPYMVIATQDDLLCARFP